MTAMADANRLCVWPVTDVDEVAHLKVPRALLTVLSCNNRLNVGVTHIRNEDDRPQRFVKAFSLLISISDAFSIPAPVWPSLFVISRVVCSTLAILSTCKSIVNVKFLQKAHLLSRFFFILLAKFVRVFDASPFFWGVCASWITDCHLGSSPKTIMMVKSLNWCAVLGRPPPLAVETLAPGPGCSPFLIFSSSVIQAVRVNDSSDVYSILPNMNQYVYSSS